MTEHIVSISDPNIRKAYDLSIEFINKVYKKSFLDTIDYVIVTTTSSKDLRETAEKIKKLGFPEIFQWLLTECFFATGSAGYGAYVPKDFPPDSPPYSTVFVCSGKEGVFLFMITAHEHVHHLFELNKVEIVKAFFRTELSEIVPIVDLFPPDAIETVESQLDDLVSKLNEFVADYITYNYFLLLNTKPLLDHRVILRMGDLLPYKSNYFAWFYTGVSDFIKILWDIAYKTKIVFPRKEDIVILRKTRRKFEYVDELTDLEKFRNYLHEIFKENIVAMPRDVYLSDPERYKPIYTDAKWDEMKKRDVAVMKDP
jgi:hypothetical protein